LYIIWRYHKIKGMTEDERSDVVPRVVIFGGKAAPGYYIAKLVIKLINAVARKINDDVDIEGLLKVIFIPNYNVSLAELLIPASDLSQHISTAGMEASGTSNMKFAMNGGLIIGTLDGANIEIREEIGIENMFIFGTRAEKVEEERNKVREGKTPLDPRLKEVIQMITDGFFGDFPESQILIDSFLGGRDYYLLTTDWDSYLQAQEEVDKTYLDKAKWTKMSIYSTAGTGKFSSDRSVKEYSEKIWKLEPCARPGPMSVDVHGLIEERLGDRGVNSVSPLDRHKVSLDRVPDDIAIVIASYSPSSSPYW